MIIYICYSFVARLDIYTALFLYLALKVENVSLASYLAILRSLLVTLTSMLHQ